MKTQANSDPAWVNRMADVEDGSEFSVGGLIQELGMFRVPVAPAPVAKSAFAMLIEFRRRALRLANICSSRTTRGNVRLIRSHRLS